MGGSNSVVECQLPKLDVAGSIPVSRSKSLIRESFPFEWWFQETTLLILSQQLIQ